jgi:hypothetical protein
MRLETLPIKKTRIAKIDAKAFDVTKENSSAAAEINIDSIIINSP